MQHLTTLSAWQEYCFSKCTEFTNATHTLAAEVKSPRTNDVDLKQTQAVDFEMLVQVFDRYTAVIQESALFNSEMWLENKLPPSITRGPSV